ncbi:hypothetical protein MMC25_002433 [Agyrium rufum]|nr:hypothetical protein [Agyrium rufum]
MARYLSPRSRSDFRVAIFCASPVEAGFVEALFEGPEEEDRKWYGKAAGDKNAYSLGMICGHNVVLARLPKRGNASSGAASVNLRSSFPGIELALVVGMCGAVPTHPETGTEILLGDCIISTAVIEYDFGRHYHAEGSRRKHDVENCLGRAGPEIRSFLSKISTFRGRSRLHTRRDTYLADIQAHFPEARYPGRSQDRLFEPAYVHRHRNSEESCKKCAPVDGSCLEECSTLGCESEYLIPRERLRRPEDVTPQIHFGRFGSANAVMKSGEDRARVSQADDIVAFETESAGIWDQLPTVVIKAACNYADSHASRQWQTYAAASAAACSKAYLQEWVSSDPPFEPGKRSSSTSRTTTDSYHEDFITNSTSDYLPYSNGFTTSGNGKAQYTRPTVMFDPLSVSHVSSDIDGDIMERHLLEARRTWSVSEDAEKGDASAEALENSGSIGSWSLV